MRIFYFNQFNSSIAFVLDIIFARMLYDIQTDNVVQNADVIQKNSNLPDTSIAPNSSLSNDELDLEHSDNEESKKPNKQSTSTQKGKKLLTTSCR